MRRREPSPRRAAGSQGPDRLRRNAESGRVGPTGDLAPDQSRDGVEDLSEGAVMARAGMADVEQPRESRRGFGAARYRSPPCREERHLEDASSPGRRTFEDARIGHRGPYGEVRQERTNPLSVKRRVTARLSPACARCRSVGSGSGRDFAESRPVGMGAGDAG